MEVDMGGWGMGRVDGNVGMCVFGECSVTEMQLSGGLVSGGARQGKGRGAGMK
jgi:hypothetical protein